MTYFVTTAGGESVDGPSPARMREILAELDGADDEHGDAWLTHESEWTLLAGRTGHVVFENVEAGSPSPRHMHGVARERVLELWILLAAGDLATLEQQPWQPGYGNAPFTDEERGRLAEELLALDRRFYDSLGVERGQPRCQAPKCARGAVVASLFCRVHHFENVKRAPCPFSH